MLKNLGSETPNALDSKYEVFSISKDIDLIDFKKENNVDLDLDDAIAMPNCHEPDTAITSESDALDPIDG